MTDDKLFERIQAIKWWLNWGLILLCLVVFYMTAVRGDLSRPGNMIFGLISLGILAYRFFRRFIHRCPRCGPRGILQGWVGCRKHTRSPSDREGEVICETSFVCYHCEEEHVVAVYRHRPASWLERFPRIRATWLGRLFEQY